MLFVQGPDHCPLGGHMGVVFISSSQALLSCLLTLHSDLLSPEASQVPLVVKNAPASAGDKRDKFSISGWEDPVEEGITTHSSVLAWTIPRTEEPGSLQFTGSQITRHD